MLLTRPCSFEREIRRTFYGYTTNISLKLGIVLALESWNFLEIPHASVKLGCHVEVISNCFVSLSFWEKYVGVAGFALIKWPIKIHCFIIEVNVIVCQLYSNFDTNANFGAYLTFS